MPPWELVEGDDPRMWGNGSVVYWNCATYRLLGDPLAVEILYNEEEGKLGFRGVYYGGALRVRQYEQCYCVDIDEHLDNLDLSLPGEWEATPVVETEEEAPGIPHQQRIIWIAIPTE